VRDLLALGHQQLADALLAVRAAVEHVAVVAHDALVDAEEVDSPGERVGAGLEHVGEHLAVLRRLEADAVGVEAPMLHWRGQVLHERVEQAVRPQVRGGDAAGDREAAGPVRAVLERLDDLLRVRCRRPPGSAP
jgi:hypothetical protein